MKMKDKVMGVMQKLGHCVVIPIGVLPLAGFFLAMGATLTTPDSIAMFPILGNKLVNEILSFLGQIGGVPFANIALLFCISIAFGFCDDDGFAALASVITYLVMNVAIGNILNITSEMVAANPSYYTTVLGYPTLPCGIMGGVLSAFITVILYKRFKNIKLPMAFQFFQGKRFVLLTCLLGGIAAGAVISVIWPPIQNALVAASNYVAEENTGVAAFLYGVVERLLIPFGLNGLWVNTFTYNFGEYVNAAGNVIIGDTPIFFAQLSDNVELTAGTFMTGMLPLKMFTMPAIAFALYRAAAPEKRKAIMGILLSAGVTSFVCGITEPLEFSFIFIAPILLVVDAFISGIGFCLASLSGAHCGITFSGGLIDTLLINIIPGKATQWWRIIPVGIVTAVLAYFSFYYIIKWFHLPTLGREKEEDREIDTMPLMESKQKKQSKAVSKELVLDIIEAYGGIGNIKKVNACFSRLRVNVIDKQIVDKQKLKDIGAYGVVEVGDCVQAVFGVQAEMLKNEVNNVLQKK